MTILLPLLLAAVSFADVPATEAPEFLLGDVGVRVDLPGGWRMTRWSDWDFKAETTDGAVKLFAWATPLQVDPQAEDLDRWVESYVAKADELDLTEPKVEAKEIRDGVAWTEISFPVPGGRGHMFTAGVPVEGQVFHLATFAASSRRQRASDGLAELVERLEVRAAPAEVAWGAAVEAKGIATELPDAWRPPLESEVPVIAKTLATLGVEKLDPCWVALDPQPHDPQSVLAACQGGMWLGVVDGYSFADEEAELRARLFGDTPIPAATPLELPDRTGFLYAIDGEEQAVAVGIVPYDRGVAQMWAVGPAEDADQLAETVATAFAATTFSGSHPASAGERVSYYLTYRPFHPFVLLPAGGLLLIGAVGTLTVLGVGRKNKYEELVADEG